MSYDGGTCQARQPSRVEEFLSRTRARLLRLNPWRKKEQSNLVRYAINELKAAGLYDEDSDYGGMLAEAVVELIQTFSDQDHSGFSAARTVQLFQKLAMFKPLLPLQGTDEEWGEPYGSDGTRQNKRCSNVFMDKDGQAYDIYGKVFRDPSGATYTDGDSRVPVTFPYVPKSEMVDVGYY